MLLLLQFLDASNRFKCIVLGLHCSENLLETGQLKVIDRLMCDATRRL